MDVRPSKGEGVMHTIQLELEEDLAARLIPYRDKLPEMLELGLQALQEQEAESRKRARNRMLEVLSASPGIRVPEPPNGHGLYVRHTPVQAAGEPASQIVIAQRGEL
jgi:hypothetical protein